jgi:hypothetical protein
VNSNDECGNWSACSVARPVEVEILKEALDVARVKKPILPLPSWNGRKDRNEGRGRHACGRPLEPDRAGSIELLNDQQMRGAITA